MENNGIIKNGNGENPGTSTQPEKKGLAKLLDTVHRKYDEIRYSRAGKIGAKILTGIGIGVTAKVAYDKGVEKGKSDVVPTVVYIERNQETGETTENAETTETTEKTAEETATA